MLVSKKQSAIPQWHQALSGKGTRGYSLKEDVDAAARVSA